MGFSNIVDLAKQQAEEEARQRKADLEALNARQAAANEPPTTGSAGYAAANPRAVLSPSAQQEVEQDRVMTQMSNKRFDNARAALSDPLPTTNERLDKWFGPAASFLHESPQERQDELTVDPRGRAARLDSIRSGMEGPPAGAGPTRSFSVGTGAHGEPYFTNLSRGELHTEHHDRNAIRESGGMAPEGPPVTDLHPLHLGGGGAFSSTKSGFAERGFDPQSQAKEEMLRTLKLEGEAASNAKLTPREQAGALLQHEPAWDQKFASAPSYGEARRQLTEAIAKGDIPPETGGLLEKKYDTYMDQALKANSGERVGTARDFAALLNAKRMPDGRAVEAAASDTGPGVHAESQQAVTQAAQGAHAQAATGPGTQVPPKIGPTGPEPPREPEPAFDPIAFIASGGSPATGPSNRQMLAGATRAAGGVGGAALGSLAGPAGTIAGGAAGAAGGEELAQRVFEGTAPSARDDIVAALFGGAGAALPAARTALGAVGEAAGGAAGKGLAAGASEVAGVGAAPTTGGSMMQRVAMQRLPAAAPVAEEAVQAGGAAVPPGGPLAAQKAKLLSKLGISPAQASSLTEAQKDDLLKQLMGGASSRTPRPNRGR